jgi:gamma-glutamyltranspeptidase
MSASATIDRKQLRQRIDDLETLHEALTAIDEIKFAELKPGETVRLRIVDTEDRSIASITSIDPLLVLAFLRATVAALKTKDSQ